MILSAVALALGLNFHQPLTLRLSRAGRGPAQVGPSKRMQPPVQFIRRGRPHAITALTAKSINALCLEIKVWTNTCVPEASESDEPGTCVPRDYCTGILT